MRTNLLTTEATDTAFNTDQSASKFAEVLLKHLLKGVESKDKLVRFRTTQLIAFIMNDLQEMEFV